MSTEMPTATPTATPTEMATETQDAPRFSETFAASTANALLRIILTCVFALLVVVLVGQVPDAKAAAMVGTGTGTGTGPGPVAPIPLVTPPDLSADQAALQRGARMFATYCASCHDAHLVQYGQLAALGLSPAEIDAGLNPLHAASNAPMLAAMRPDVAEKAFGAAPPDLSLEARAKGRAWLYTYLRTFYSDPARPMGSNNLLVPNVAMPDVLAGLHGQRTAVFLAESDDLPKNALDSGKNHVKERHFVKFEQNSPGSLSAPQYDAALADLVAYMGWMAEPSTPERRRVGPWVIGFLLIFSFSAWRLCRSYWKSAGRKR
jgi:ubiquinol-cytochrome c reductase cytochrome c1 subunit